MSGELEQKRRTVRVLELLNQSFEAHKSEDYAGFARAMIEAEKLDMAALVGIQMGMRIGEIPNPEYDWIGWGEYLSVNQESLAQAEAAQ
jgi:hypothetical protein